MASPKTTPSPTTESKKLGTFGGVFTPSILTILGIILFLRVGYVVGAAGVPRALLILFMANAISVLTSVSLAAIATNLRVGKGGDYYLISRTLGIQYGGALGLILFLAQSVSVAFYCIGFAEAVRDLLGSESATVLRLLAASSAALLFVLAWLGAEWATRFQYVVMAALVIALASFFYGGAQAWTPEAVRGNLVPSSTAPFWAIFAIFFPAVTGFTQGVSLSGDLRDPSRSLPLGTFAAVGVSFVVYVVVVLLFAGALPGTVLVNDLGSMRRVSVIPALVDLGVICATLSSALASFMGAPRILQAVAGDKIFPGLGLFAHGTGETQNPRRALLLAAAIAATVIAMGDLNAIAPLVSMFFLISYGLLNYATFFEAQAQSPSFRPRFRWFDRRLSLLGAFACAGVMFAIDARWSLVAVAIMASLHVYLGRRARLRRWSDSTRAHRLQRVRQDLFAIAAEADHPADWRPVILAFSENPERLETVLQVTNWLEGESGFSTLVRIADARGSRAQALRDEVKSELQAKIKSGNYSTFAKVVVVEDARHAFPTVLQAHGLGPVRANTVLVNWLSDTSNFTNVHTYGNQLRYALRFGCNIVVVSGSTRDKNLLQETRAEDRRIDVWFRQNATGTLTLLLAYLTTRHRDWKEAKIRVLVTSSGDPEQVVSAMREKLDAFRIIAEVVVVQERNLDQLTQHSAGSELVLLPLRLEGDAVTSVFDASLDDIVANLGYVGFVLAKQDLDLDVDPEDGVLGELARAEEAARRARESAERAQSEVQRVEEGLAAGVDSSRVSSDGEPIPREAELAALRKRALKAKAKAEATQQELEALQRRMGRAEASGEQPAP